MSAMALSLDGKSGCLVLPALQEDFANGITFQAWARLRAVGNWQRIIELGNGPGQDNVFLSAVASTTTAGCGHWRDGGVLAQLCGEALPADEWVHLSGTIDPHGHTCLYLNGQLVQSGPGQPLTVARRAHNAIGRSAWAHDALWCGDVAEVRVFALALDGRTIAANWNRRATGTEDALVACWPLDSVSDLAPGVFRDLSPHQRHARAEGAVQATEGPALLQAEPPARRQALRLAGGSAVQLPAWAHAGGALSLMAWIRPDGLSHWQRVLEYSNGAPSDNLALALDGGTNDFALLVFHGADPTPSIVVAPNAVALGGWTHVAATIDAAGMASVYVNGQLRLQRALRQPLAAVQRRNGWIGRSAWAHDGAFAGCITDVRVYGQCLAAVQVVQALETELTAAAAATGTAGLLAAWPLNEQQATADGDRLADLGPLALHGHLQRSAGDALSGPAAGPVLLPATTAPAPAQAEAAPARCVRLTEPKLPSGHVWVDQRYTVQPLMAPPVTGAFGQGLTLQAWHWLPGAATAGRTHLLWGTWYDGGDALQLQLRGNGVTWDVLATLSVRSQDGKTAAQQSLTCPMGAAAQEWSHLSVAVQGNGTVQVCLNGRLTAALAFGRGMPAIGAERIPQECRMSTNGALLSDFRLWQRALSVHEVASHWWRRAHPFAPDLVLNWRCDEPVNSTTLYDSGPQRLHWTPLLQATDPKALNPKAYDLAAGQMVQASVTGRTGPQPAPSLLAEMVADLRTDLVPATQADGTLGDVAVQLHEVEITVRDAAGAPLAQTPVRVVPRTDMTLLDYAASGLFENRLVPAGHGLLRHTDALGRVRLRCVAPHNSVLAPDLCVARPGLDELTAVRADDAAWARMGKTTTAQVQQATPGAATADADACASLIRDLARVGPVLGLSAPGTVSIQGFWNDVGRATKKGLDEIEKAGKSALKPVTKALNDVAKEVVQRTEHTATGASTWVLSAAKSASSGAESLWQETVAKARDCALAPMDDAARHCIRNASSLGVDLSGQLTRTGGTVANAVQLVGTVITKSGEQIFRVVVRTASDAWNAMQAIAERIGMQLEALVKLLAQGWSDLLKFFQNAEKKHRKLHSSMDLLRLQTPSLQQDWSQLGAALPQAAASRWTLGQALCVSTPPQIQLPKELNWFTDHLSRALGKLDMGFAGMDLEAWVEKLLPQQSEQMFDALLQSLDPMTSLLQDLQTRVQRVGGAPGDLTLSEALDFSRNALPVGEAVMPPLAKVLDPLISGMVELVDAMLATDLVIPAYLDYLRRMLPDVLMPKALKDLHFDLMWLPALLWQATEALQNTLPKAKLDLTLFGDDSAVVAAPANASISQASAAADSGAAATASGSATAAAALPIPSLPTAATGGGASVASADSNEAADPANTLSDADCRAATFSLTLAATVVQAVLGAYEIKRGASTAEESTTVRGALLGLRLFLVALSLCEVAMLVRSAEGQLAAGQQQKAHLSRASASCSLLNALLDLIAALTDFSGLAGPMESRVKQALSIAGSLCAALQLSCGLGHMAEGWTETSSDNASVEQRARATLTMSYLGIPVVTAARCALDWAEDYYRAKATHDPTVEGRAQAATRLAWCTGLKWAALGANVGQGVAGAVLEFG